MTGARYRGWVLGLAVLSPRPAPPALGTPDQVRLGINFYDRLARTVL